MKKRDYELVKEGKYNMRAIMQRAWAYVKNYGGTFKSALKSAWADARVKMSDYHTEVKLNENGLPKKSLSLSDLYADPFGNLARGSVCR